MRDYWNDTDGNGGAFYWNLNNSSTNSNTNHGSRLLKLVQQKNASDFPCHLAKIRLIKAGTSRLSRTFLKLIRIINRINADFKMKGGLK